MKYGNIASPNIIDTTCEVVHDKEVKAVEANTTLLIHGGGPNNGVTFYDNSTTARALTTVGDTKFDSSQYKFRVSSIKFDGTGDYITALDSDDWDFGSGNFTIDTWVRYAALPAPSALMGLAGQYEIGPETYWNWFIDNSAGTYRFSVGAHGITGFGATVNIDSLVVNTWYHFAVVRNGNLMLFFKDGIQQGISQPFTGSITPIASVLAVGSLRVSDYTNGWLDEFRISKGIARWTSDFTPPTAPYDSSITQYVIDGLDGDTDEEYQLMIRQVSGYAANSGVLLRLNNDSGSNYGRQYLHAQDTTTVAGRAVTSYMLFNCSANLGEVGMAQINIYAKSGKVRTAIAKEVGNIATTTVTAIALVGYSWNNTVDNITSMTVINPSNPVFGTGSRIILLKKRQLTTGTKTGEIDPQGTTYGHWQLIYDNTLVAAATSLTISGLNGDKDVMYRVICRHINGYNGAGYGVGVQPNGVATNTVYGSQSLLAINAVTSAVRYTAGPIQFYSWTDPAALNNVSYAEFLIYAKSGYIRTCITQATGNISGTTVGNTDLVVSCWNNTTDNITSLVISAYQTNSLGIGTHISLWRLNL